MVLEKVMIIPLIHVKSITFFYKKILLNYSALIPHEYVDGLVQDCSNSPANALELLPSCIKPMMRDPQTVFRTMPTAYVSI